MRKGLLLLFLFSSLMLQAQYFQHSYGWGPFNTAPSVAWTDQHVFGLFGSFSSSTSGQTDYVLLRVDSSGNFIDAHAYGSNGVESAQHILALPDSGYLLTGFSNGFTANSDYNAYLIRTDAIGDTVWTTSFGSPVWDFAFNATILSDGNFLITGSSNQSASGVTAGWVALVSSTGQLLREKRIELNGANLWLNDAVQAAGGAIYLCGYSESLSTQHQSGCIFKINHATLDSLWSLTMDPGTGDSRLSGLTTTLDGQLVACGFRIEQGRTDKDILVVNVDTTGASAWSRIYATTGDESLHDVTTCGDSIICAGMTTSFGGGGSDNYVVALDSAGYFLHGSTFGSTEEEIGNAIIPTGSKSFAIFGTTTSYGPGLQSMMLVTVDSLLNSSNTFIVSSEVHVGSSCSLSIYPNPAEEKTTIRTKQGASGIRKTVSIFNIQGVLMHVNETTSDEITLNLSEWASGYYQVNIRYPDGTFQSGKLAVIHLD